MEEDYSKRSFEFEGVRYQMVKTEKGLHMCEICEAAGRVCNLTTGKPTLRRSCVDMVSRDGWHYVKVPQDLPAPKDPSTKYHRAIYGAWNDPEVHEDAQGRKYLNVDVYSVLAAFAPDHPTGHAVKKLLCAGNRDKGSKIQDLKEAIVAIEAAIYAAEVSG